MISTLECRNCAASLVPPQGQTQFFCQYCGATVVVERPDVPVGRGATAEAERPLKPTGDLSKFTIEKSGEELAISWPWRSVAGCFLVPFAIFWNGFVAFWMMGALGTGEPFFAMFGIPFVLVGLGLIYVTAAVFVNSSTVRVRDGILSVEHGPLPWRHPTPIPVDKVQQIYVHHKQVRTKNGHNSMYELMAVRTDGTETKLLTEQERDTPRSLERMLEVHLGIEDRAVVGEA